MALFWQKGNKEEKAAKAETSAPKKKTSSKAPKKAAPKTETKAVAVAKPAADKASKGAKGEIVFPKNSPLKRPRVTEKAGRLSEKGIYTFEVAVNASAHDIAKAIESAYKVTSVKVSVAPIPAKSMFVRGKKGSTSSGKKAYVYLKKGDTIEFI